MIDDAVTPANADSHEPATQSPANTGPITDAASGVAVRVERELAELEKLPLVDHADAYARIHATLDRELAEIDGA